MASSHHGQEQEFMRRFMEQIEGRAKRHYSEGRIGGNDDGDLALAVAADRDRGIVVVDFGKNVSWLGMNPEQAIGLAQMLIEKAQAVADKPLTVNL